MDSQLPTGARTETHQGGMLKEASRKRVCHIAATNEGATWMLEQLRDLRDIKGYDVSAIISAGDGSLAEKLTKEAIPFHRFDFQFPPPKGWRMMLNRVIELAVLLRKERYDVVQTHLFASMVLGRLATWLADVPVRLTMIAGPYHLEAYTPRWIDSSTCWMETGIVASCEYTRTLYRQLGVDDSRLSVIYYGPDERKFARSKIIPADLHKDLKLPKGTRLVGMVAYMYPRLPASRWTPIILHGRANKRQEDLIQAAPAILREIPNARIILVGSGWTEAGEVELQLARKLVKSLGLENRVIFTGYRNDVNSVLAALDVAVQAALSENLGGTIEALLMECPTVATRTGGLVDSIRDGETGLLVNPLDPADLADGVVRMLRDPDAAHRMASNGRQLMLRDFTLSRTVDALDVLYREQMTSSVFGFRRGYRLHKSMLRMMLALPVFAYLAARLAWDTKFLTLWDAGWRPRPIPQLKALQRKAGILWKRLKLWPRVMQRKGRALWKRLKRWSRAMNRKGRVLWTRLKHSPQTMIATVKAGPAAIAGSVSSIAAAMLSAMERGLRNGYRTMERGLQRGRRNVYRACIRAFIRLRLRLRRLTRYCTGQLRRLRTWIILRPYYAYGYVRYLLQGTELLRRWDIFFARIRGRKSN